MIKRMKLLTGLLWILLMIVTLFTTSALAYNVAISDDDDDSIYTPPPPGYGDPIRVDGSMVIPSGDPGQAVNIVIPLYYSREFGWNSVREITITPQVSTDLSKWPFEIKQTTYTQTVTLSQNRARPTFNLTISQKATAGTYPIDFELVYVAANGSTRETKETTIRTYVKILSDGTEVVKKEEEDSGQIVITSTPTPSAAYGERVVMTLELMNTGLTLNDVTIKPIISTELDKFPFVVEKQNYEQSLGNFAAGTSRNITYDFLLSEHVSSGAKAIKFALEYSRNGVRSTGSVTAYIHISRAKEDDKEEEEKDEENKPKPKLIVSSYSIEPNKIYAGANFTLDMQFTNTSEQPIQNLTITITNADEENAYVVPAKNGSNTVYVRNMGAGSSIQTTLELQVRPDTPAKPNMLSVVMEYEDEKYKAYTASANITVPINQEIRLVLDEPRFDMPFVEQGLTVYPYFSIINMGKSSIYNVMVTVEGPGLSIEERTYLGTMQAGQQNNVDIGIIANEAGQIEGAIVVAFEDEYGDKLEERQNFTITVQEAFSADFPFEGDYKGDDMFYPDSPGFDSDQQTGLLVFIRGSGKWWIIGGGVIILALLIIILRKRRIKKRQAELSDEND
ncbi:MAG: hypothetical protein FWG61_02200 [Firmicutes bacterium]|nr:hypothetical protein [Bacillota bacterium]